jgi:hypothetical protein
MVESKPVSLNKFFGSLGMDLGVEVGSPAWTDAGLHAYSGQTGGHGAYGHRHDHLISTPYVHAVLSNYALRPAYYDKAPYRQAGYLVGSRPVGWVPEEAGDLATGEALWSGVKVSGPDLEHFALSPLWAVADSKGVFVKVRNKVVPACDVAKEMLKHLVEAHAGMLLTPNGISGYLVSERSASLILRNMVQTQKRGLNQHAVNIMAVYLNSTLLPWLEKWPLLPTGEEEKQVYNGIYWLLPALYDTMLITPLNLSLRGRLMDVCVNMSEHVAALEAYAPGHGCEVEKVGSWVPLSGVVTQGYFGPWGFRAQSVAAEILQSEMLASANAKFMDVWRPKLAGNEQWFVDAHGEYVK